MLAKYGGIEIERIAHRKARGYGREYGLKRKYGMGDNSA